MNIRWRFFTKQINPDLSYIKWCVKETEESTLKRRRPFIEPASPRCEPRVPSPEKFPPKNPKTGIIPVAGEMHPKRLVGIPEENGTTISDQTGPA